jgi:general secretion pathway protein G
MIMKRATNCKKLGFSLLEVVIVVAILAILAAIGIPRMSRGSRGAGDSALKSNLSLLRNGIDVYSAEHNGDFPAVGTFANQLTTFTDSAGSTNASKTTTYIYGPYLRTIPPLTVGAKKGKNGVSADGAGADDGWIYTASSGAVVANTDANEVDDAGVLYNTY